MSRLLESETKCDSISVSLNAELQIARCIKGGAGFCGSEKGRRHKKQHFTVKTYVLKITRGMVKYFKFIFLGTFLIIKNDFIIRNVYINYLAVLEGIVKRV